MQQFDHILDALATKTQRVFDTALGAERHQLLTRRLHQLYGALELARLLEYGRLARRIETQVDACRRNIEVDSGTCASWINSHNIEITVVLTETEAWEYAQFLKRVCFSDYRGHATSDAEAYHMINAGERIRGALADRGYAPR